MQFTTEITENTEKTIELVLSVFSVISVVKRLDGPRLVQIETPEKTLSCPPGRS
jgi:hypothetical protein